MPKSRAFVEVPPPCVAQPPAPALMPSGGKKSLASIQAETATFAYPPLEPKGACAAVASSCEAYEGLLGWSCQLPQLPTPAAKTPLSVCPSS